MNDPRTRPTFLLPRRNPEQTAGEELRGDYVLPPVSCTSSSKTVRRAADGLGLDLDIYRIGDGGDLADIDGRWADAYGIAPSGAILVCPDGFVGWRAEAAVEQPERVLGQALSRLLCRELVTADSR